MAGMLQATYSRSNRRHTLACMGDSHTFNPVWGNLPRDFYPAQLAGALIAAGASIQARNYGVSGQTSSQMCARKAALTQYEVPDVAVLYAGANDPYTAQQGTVQASPTPTASTFTLDTGKGALYPVGCHVLVGSTSALVTAVSGDALTVFGLSSAPSAGITVSHDTAGNIVDMGNTLKSAGCPRIIVGTMHYLNYSSGGDTLSTPVAYNATLRAAQTAAATTLGAPLADFYGFMRNRIVAGTDAQGSFSWHVLDANQHLNPYGEGLLATCLLQTLQAQPGWLAALK